MRTLLKVVVDSDAGNELFRAGTAEQTLKQFLEVLNPEAVYGLAEEGHRTLLAVFDLADRSQIPQISEPIFQSLRAKITMTPCMNLEDNQKGVAKAVQASARLSGGERRWHMTPLAKGLLVASAGLPPVDYVGKTCNGPPVILKCSRVAFELSPGLSSGLSRLQSDTDQLIA